jgi:hypothetical protein
MCESNYSLWNKKEKFKSKEEITSFSNVNDRIFAGYANVIQITLIYYQHHTFYNECITEAGFKMMRRYVTTLSTSLMKPVFL